MSPRENFKYFLMERGAYEKYCAAIYEQRGSMFNDVTGGSRLKQLYKIIDHTLTWANTREKQDYWSDLNNQWNRAVENGTTFKPAYKSIW